MATEIRELNLRIPRKLADRLEAEAKEANLSLSELVQEALEDYFVEEIEDSSDEEILNDLREALRDVREGNLHSADEVLAEIRKELNEENAD